MKNRRTKYKTNEKFTWKIDNFSVLGSKKYSETFFLSDYAWQIHIGLKKYNPDYLSIYLHLWDIAHLPKGWSGYTHFKLTLINQVKASQTIIQQTSHEFNARDSSWGFHEFVQLDRLCDSSNGFIVNDTCIIEAKISVRKSGLEKPVDQAVTKENYMASLVDFRGLGKIEKDFVPLLEEVCSWHPSLVDSQRKRKRTSTFTEWAFTALGRVLHFLKTKKVKDMNEDACNQLQILWEELGTFGFDLSWLEPHLQSALGMKTYNERAAEVKRLRVNTIVLEHDLKRATRKLVEAEKGFVERDLDAELGYGRP